MPAGAPPGEFCWLDLAASDAGRAQQFYAQAFGWTFQDQPTLGGCLTRCHAGSRAVGSLYQLQQAHLERGVPSHWTPYIAVGHMDAALARVAAGGGRAVVLPLDFPGTARIALIQDAVGALVGLWQPLRGSPLEDPA